MKSILLISLSTPILLIGCEEELPAYRLTVTSDPGGSVFPAEEIYNYGENATVTATVFNHQKKPFNEDKINPDHKFCSDHFRM